MDSATLTEQAFQPYSRLKPRWEASELHANSACEQPGKTIVCMDD